jgi:hypothetical protein
LVVVVVLVRGARQAPYFLPKSSRSQKKNWNSLSNNGFLFKTITFFLFLCCILIVLSVTYFVFQNTIWYLE